jgi:hypothetical protein
MPGGGSSFILPVVLVGLLFALLIGMMVFRMFMPGTSVQRGATRSPKQQSGLASAGFIVLYLLMRFVIYGGAFGLVLVGLLVVAGIVAAAVFVWRQAASGTFRQGPPPASPFGFPPMPPGGPGMPMTPNDLTAAADFGAPAPAHASWAPAAAAVAPAAGALPFQTSTTTSVAAPTAGAPGAFGAGFSAPIDMTAPTLGALTAPLQAPQPAPTPTPWAAQPAPAPQAAPTPTPWAAQSAPAPQPQPAPAPQPAARAASIPQRTDRITFRCQKCGADNAIQTRPCIRCGSKLA